MKTKTIAASIAAALSLAAFAPTASAEAGQWFGHLRAAYIDPADESTAIPALEAPADVIDVSSEYAPDISIGYFFTNNFALELLLTIPQQHAVYAETGEGDIYLGHFTHLPPTLFAQYHFAPEGKINPYIGVGLNLTFIMEDELAVDGGELGVLPLKLDSNSIGPALQVGVDFAITDKMSISADIKKIWISSDVTVPGVGKVTQVDVDPFIYSIGIGYKF